MSLTIYTRTVAKSTKIEDAPLSGRTCQHPHLADLPADFDPTACPIIARHFYGLLPERGAAA
jgi:hypothetical protein